MTLPNGKFTYPGISRIPDVTTRQGFDSLTNYLGGWIDWSGTADLAFSAGVYTKGNATVQAMYRIQGDYCHYVGVYTIGNTTTFPGAGAIMRLSPLPANIHSMYLAGGANVMPVGDTFAADTGVQGYYGKPMVTTAAIIAFMTPTATPTFWTNAAPFAFGNTDLIGWNVRFRIQS